MCMGFSLRPRNAVLSSPAWRQGTGISYNEALEAAPSPSPPILKRISISTGCSRLRDNKRDQGQTREMDAASAAVETERAPDVWTGRRFAQADPGVFDRHARIGARAAKPHAEAPANAASGQPAWGRMSARVAPHTTPRGARRGARYEKSAPVMRRADKRGQKIDEIIELGRGEAERACRGVLWPIMLSAVLMAL